jgi:hypothetical protein
LIDLADWRRRYLRPASYSLIGVGLIAFSVSATLEESELWQGPTTPAEIVELDLWEGRKGDAPECHVRYRYRAERGIFSSTANVKPEWCQQVRVGDSVEVHYSRRRPGLSRPHDRYLLRAPGQYVPFAGLAGAVFLLLAYVAFIRGGASLWN